MTTVEASAKIAGYNFQFERALYRLFSNEAGSTLIGVETDDDVVEIKSHENGYIEIIFEQDKLSTKISGQPFQDSSKNLWHTLHIWLSAMNEFRKKYAAINYCLVTNKSVPTQAFAQKLSSATEETEINECLLEIRALAAKVGASDKSEVKNVASYPDEMLNFLIKNIRLMDDYATTSGVDPKNATIQLLQLPPDMHAKGLQIYEGLLGMMVSDCQEAWLKKEQAWFDKERFTKRLHEEVAAHRLERYVERPLMSTAFKEYLKTSGDFIFIKQLQRLGLSSETCDRALSHYWGFYAERVRLQKEGDVLPVSWLSREELLHQRWQLISDSASLGAGVNSDDEDRFRKIYAKTIDGNYTAKLGLHETTYPYFTSGNYHDLANKPDEDFFIHWHSSFLPKKDKDGSA